MSRGDGQRSCTWDKKVTSSRAAAAHDAAVGATGPDLEQIRCARLAVARAARSASECRELLEMLGLMPHQIDGDRRSSDGVSLFL